MFNPEIKNFGQQKYEIALISKVKD